MAAGVPCLLAFLEVGGESCIFLLVDLTLGIAIIYNNRGTITYERLVAGEIAIFVLKGEAYLISIFAQPCFESDTTYEKMEEAFPKIAQSFWDFILGNS